MRPQGSEDTVQRVSGQSCCASHGTCSHLPCRAQRWHGNKIPLQAVQRGLKAGSACWIAAGDDGAEKGRGDISDTAAGIAQVIGEQRAQGHS